MPKSDLYLTIRLGCSTTWNLQPFYVFTKELIDFCQLEEKIDMFDNETEAHILERMSSSWALYHKRGNLNRYDFCYFCYSFNWQRVYD